MRPSCVWLLGLIGTATTGCLGALPAPWACEEVGAAVSALVLNCTGDVDAATSAYDTFTRDYACQIASYSADDPPNIVLQDSNQMLPEDAYACAANIRRIPCTAVGSSPQVSAVMSRSVPTCQQFLTGDFSQAGGSAEATVRSTDNSNASLVHCFFTDAALTSFSGATASATGSAKCVGGTLSFSLAIANGVTTISAFELRQWYTTVIAPALNDGGQVSLVPRGVHVTGDFTLAETNVSYRVTLAAP